MPMNEYAGRRAVESVMTVKALEVEVEGIGAHSSLPTLAHLQALLQAHL